VVVEDVHWADDATLDVLRYLGRRVEDLPAVLVVTYRDDEVGPAHPLQRVLGALGGPGVHRLRLARLSRAAVARLAGGTTVTSAGLFCSTAGNPFDGVPATVIDAVLARVRRLSAPTQAALDLLSVVPSGVALPLARSLFGGGMATLAEAERHGVLDVRTDTVAFRHELARRAVEGRCRRACEWSSTPARGRCSRWTALATPRRRVRRRHGSARSWGSRVRSRRR